MKTMTLNEAIEKLNELEKSSYALGHAQSILYVDGDTVAPKNSWKASSSIRTKRTRSPSAGQRS